MAAPIYRDEFERRFEALVGYVDTSIENLRIKLTRDINANTDAKFATVITHYDEQIATLTAEIDILKEQVAILKEDGVRRERKLDVILKALNVSVEDL